MAQQGGRVADMHAGRSGWLTNSDATAAKADGGSFVPAAPTQVGRKPALSFATLKEGQGQDVQGPTRKAQLHLAGRPVVGDEDLISLFSVVGGIALIIAVWVLWGIISLSGGLSAMQQGITAMVGADSGGGCRCLTMWRVLGFTVLVSVVTSCWSRPSPLFSFVYNVAASRSASNRL